MQTVISQRPLISRPHRFGEGVTMGGVIRGSRGAGASFIDMEVSFMMLRTLGEKALRPQTDLDEWSLKAFE